MANNKKPSNDFEFAKEAGNKLSQYSQVLQALQSGKFVPNALDVAAQAALEVEGKVLKADSEELVEMGHNPYMVFDYIHGAQHKFDVRTERLFKERLASIVSQTPRKTMDGLEKILYAFAPPEDKKVPDEYKPAAKIHREAAKLTSILGEYERADEGGKQSLREDVMYADIIQYYKNLYKGGKNAKDKKAKKDLEQENAQLLNVSIKWVMRNPRLCERKYKWLQGRRVEEFKAKLLGMTYDEYKTQKDKEKSDRIRTDEEHEKETENEDYDSDFLEAKKTDHSEKLDEKFRKEVPDYLLKVMDYKTLKSMYEHVWQQEARAEQRYAMAA